jgi:coatomer protein complex subunit gamma
MLISFISAIPGPSSLDASLSLNPVKAHAPAAIVPTAAETQSAYAEQLAAVPELATYGPVLGSSAKPVQLTESETEYVVGCVKHLFKEHVVFQVSLSLLLL